MFWHQVTNLLHPTPTVIPDPVTIVDEKPSIPLPRLETIRYTVEKVLRRKYDQGVLGPLRGPVAVRCARVLSLPGST